MKKTANEQQPKQQRVQSTGDNFGIDRKRRERRMNEMEHNFHVKSIIAIIGT